MIKFKIFSGNFIDTENIEYIAALGNNNKLYKKDEWI